MLEFEKYKNEIIESIKNVELQQEKTNELLLKMKEENDDEDQEAVEEETESEEEETDLDLEEEEIDLELEEEETEIQILIEQNELIIQELQEMNQNQIESSWLISLTIILALGFHYLVNQFSKW